MNKIQVLDHGYIKYIDHCGSDEGVLEAARMSVDKGFLGWGTPDKPGDERLLRHLYTNKHTSPFEMGDLTIEAKCPIMVVREWQRHRTQCLAGDTQVYFEAPKGYPAGRRRYAYKLTMKHLWDRWQPTSNKTRKDKQANPYFKRGRVQGMHLRNANEDTLEFGCTSIVDVIKGHPKPMVSITTRDGQTLTATREHKIFTPDGWRTLGECIDQNIPVAIQTTAQRNGTGSILPQDDGLEAEGWLDVPGWESLYAVSTLGNVRSKRTGKIKKPCLASSGYLVVCLNRPGTQETCHIHTLVLSAFVGPRPEGGVARHLNNNRADPRLCNLAWGTPKENTQDAIASGRISHLVVRFSPIVSVADAGVQDSYDLSVRGPYHNFVANGIVVHNSYNEMSARYIVMPDEWYIPSVERVMQANVHTTNKQAQGSGKAITEEDAVRFINALDESHRDMASRYREYAGLGIQKELARGFTTVFWYTRMRAKANLLNWIKFLSLREDNSAQWEIRQYAHAINAILTERFPRTMELYEAGRAKPLTHSTHSLVTPRSLTWQSLLSDLKTLTMTSLTYPWRRTKVQKK